MCANSGYQAFLRVQEGLGITRIHMQFWEITVLAMQELHETSPCAITYPSNAWFGAIISQTALKFM